MGPAAFKAVVRRADVSGVFDSHTSPPFFILNSNFIFDAHSLHTSVPTSLRPCTYDCGPAAKRHWTVLESEMQIRRDGRNGPVSDPDASLEKRKGANAPRLHPSFENVRP